MKKICFYLFIILICFSCSGDEPPNDGNEPSNSDEYLTAVIDGEFIDFKTTNSEIRYGVELDGFFIFGFKDVTVETTESLGISIAISKGLLLNESTYQNDNLNCNLETEICVAASFFFGPENDKSVFSLEFGGNISITFTKLNFKSGGSSEGVFSGELHSEFGDKVTVTDGKFKLPIAE